MVSESAQLVNEAAAAGAGGVFGTLGLNAKLFVAQLVNFGIVVLVMWKWVYTPLVRMMDARTKEISDGLERAKEAERQLSEANAYKERLIREANAEVHGLLEEARRGAETIRKEKLDQTKREIEKLAAEAKERLATEREAAFDALQRDIAHLVGAAVAKIGTRMDEKTQRSLVEKALEDLEHV